jgi:mono/diheme cytochrome c family protein
MTHRRPALMRRGWLCGIAAGIVALLFATASGQAQQKPGGAPATGVSVDRGKYLVNITGCHDCHSPKSQGMTPDPARLLSGRPRRRRFRPRPMERSMRRSTSPPGGDRGGRRLHRI